MPMEASFPVSGAQSGQRESRLLLGQIHSSRQWLLEDYLIQVTQLPEAHSMRLSMRCLEESMVNPVRRVPHADETGSLGQRRSWSSVRNRLAQPWPSPSFPHDPLTVVLFCCSARLQPVSAFSDFPRDAVPSGVGAAVEEVGCAELCVLWHIAHLHPYSSYLHLSGH